MSRSRSAPVILVTGANGQVGFELARELASLGDIVATSRAELDLSNADSIRAAIRRLRPDAIVNAGAYTAVDKAESERDLCFAVNALAPGILAEEARTLGCPLIHYSTDYVFDGKSSQPYTEADPTAPLNSYGASKLAGERAIEAAGGSWIVLRTSWVYGGPTSNFVTTILRLASEREELRIVNDQIGSPTWSRSVAAVTGQILAKARTNGGFTAGITTSSGVYHLTSGGTTSWHGFASAILAEDPAREQHRCQRVVAIPTEEYPTPAKRPRWSVMSNDKLAARFGVRIPSWDSQLRLFFQGRAATRNP